MVHSQNGKKDTHGLTTIATQSFRKLNYEVEPSNDIPTAQWSVDEECEI